MCWGSESESDRARKEAKSKQAVLDRQAAEDRAEAKRIRSQLEAQFGKYLESDIGYSPEQKKSLEGTAIDANAEGIQQSLANTNAIVLARSGGQPLGGNDINDLASVHTAGALDKVRSLREISQADADLALKNRFNSASILSGNAGMAQQNSQFDTNSAMQYWAQRAKLAAQPSFFGNLGASTAGAFAGKAARRIGGDGRTPPYIG